jgi:hypothetical protein
MMVGDPVSNWALNFPAPLGVQDGCQAVSAHLCISDAANSLVDQEGRVTAMSGHGQREARLRADAVAWRDRVGRDMTSAAGIAVLSHCKTSTDSVAALADRIAGLIAAGETMIEVPGGKARAAVAFLIRRGFVARIGENIRPIRDGELI